MWDGRNSGVHGPGGDQSYLLHHRHRYVEPRVINKVYNLFVDMYFTSFRVLIYMLGSGGTSPFWSGNNIKTQRKILKAKYTTKIKAFEQLSEQIKQLIKRSVERNCPSELSRTKNTPERP